MALLADYPESNWKAACNVGLEPCPRCGESKNLAKIKGCIVCLTCKFKFDCQGW